MPSRSKTRRCTSARWIRIEPPPISLPLQTMSYAYASASPGAVLERVDPLVVGRGERVVHRGPGAGTGLPAASVAGSNIGASTTQQNAHAVRVDQAGRAWRSRSGPRRAAPAPRGGRSAAAKKTASPGLAPTASASPARCACGEVLRHRAAGLAGLGVEHHVGQALGAARLGPVLPAVELLAGLRRAARHHHRADVAAGRDGAGEHPELGAAQVAGQVDQLQAVPQVGLVRAVPRHRVVPGQPRDRARRSRGRRARPTAAATISSASSITSSWVTKDISMSSWVNSGCRSARKSSSR